MKQPIMQLDNHLKGANGVHVFYNSNKVECYIENALSFITAGVIQGDFVMVIENDRIYPLIKQKLQVRLTSEQMNMVHRLDNFEFYCYRGNFHPSTIIDYFNTKLSPYIENNLSIRTWGHVEWSDLEEIQHIVYEYEKRIDKLIKERRLISVCAYDADRVPESLKSLLMKCHDIFMTDGTMIQLDQEIR